MEDYEKKYKQMHKFINDLYPHMSEYCKEKVEDFLPELKESEDEKIRKMIMEHFAKLQDHAKEQGYACDYSEVIAWLEKQGEPIDKGEISDGYHTFNELYYYRMLYNAAFFNLLPKRWCHKSKKHHDGEECFGGGWFIVMADLPTGQISNHYELKDWDLFDIPEKEIADEWDGHSPQEAAERIHKFLLEKQGDDNSISIEEMNKSIGRNIAISLINYLDDNRYEGAMNMSSIECKDLENSILDSDWGKVYRYMQKKLEKQGKHNQNPYSGVSFSYNGHTWGMCARDNGVEILIDGQVKGRVFAEETNTNAKEMLINTLERVEELNAKGYKLTDCDKNSWRDDFKACNSEQILSNSSNIGKNEQNTAGKVEPKFKVGDWCIDNEDNTIFQIVGVLDNTYTYKTNEGKEYSCSHHSLEIDTRLWTIQDAKYGDVLSWDDNKCIALFKNICGKESFNSYGFVGHITRVFESSLSYHDIEGVHPATKEQRDLLFQKMKEAGYEFDANNNLVKRL